MTDARLVLERPGRGKLLERASRFLAFASPAESPDQAAGEIARLRREYHDATHVAFAWKVGLRDTGHRRSSDAGEPPGTAGKRIAAAIDSAGVTDTVVVVVRYFGGTKLGTAGLVRAYHEVAARALQAAGRRSVYDAVAVVVTCPYKSVGALLRLLHPPEVLLVEERFGEECVFRLLVHRARLPAFGTALEQAGLAHRLSESETTGPPVPELS